jgi:glycine betaine/proline transport system permease protein
LGIRQVDREVVEAGEAFGTPPSRILTRIQIPLAIPTIMAGVNQVIMLALSMVVLAGMVGGGGLGTIVFRSLSRIETGIGFQAGLGVVILAIFLDRLTAAMGQNGTRDSGRKREVPVPLSSRGGEELKSDSPEPSTVLVGVGASLSD